MIPYLTFPINQKDWNSSNPTPLVDTLNAAMFGTYGLSLCRFLDVVLPTSAPGRAHVAASAQAVQYAKRLFELCPHALLGLRPDDKQTMLLVWASLPGAVIAHRNLSDKSWFFKPVTPSLALPVLREREDQAEAMAHALAFGRPRAGLFDRKPLTRDWLGKPERVWRGFPTGVSFFDQDGDLGKLVTIERLSVFGGDACADRIVYACINRNKQGCQFNEGLERLLRTFAQNRMVCPTLPEIVPYWIGSILRTVHPLHFFSRAGVAAEARRLFSDCPEALLSFDLKSPAVATLFLAACGNGLKITEGDGVRHVRGARLNPKQADRTIRAALASAQIMGWRGKRLQARLAMISPLVGRWMRDGVVWPTEVGT
ncbi:MAG: hypothetical protein SFU85_02340 [Candidatus Methylacidiphilales bacterium]|nr:hypothetical protein [Candidatus Methylacidiphilales bacterium]